MPRPEDILTETGLRRDGRRNDNLREWEAVVGMIPHADGSAYARQGQTKVVAIVNGPKQGAGRGSENVQVVCDFEMAAFSTAQRRKPLRHDRKNFELGAKIASTFESAIMTELYPRSVIEISIQVLQADGSVLAVAINAATLALMDAGVAMKDFVCACTASVVEHAVNTTHSSSAGGGEEEMDGEEEDEEERRRQEAVRGRQNFTYLLDLNQEEASTRGLPELTLAVLPSSKTIVMNELKSALHMSRYSGLQSFAISGCAALHPFLRRAVLARTTAMLPCLGPLA